MEARKRTGFEDPTREPRYIVAEDWFVRRSIAKDHSLAKVAYRLGRSEDSIQNFINGLGLGWLPEYDALLRTFIGTDKNSDIREAQQLLVGCGTYRTGDELQARIGRLQEIQKEELAAERAAIRSNTQPYPTGGSGYPGYTVPSSQAGTSSQSLAGPSSSSGQYYGAPRMAAYSKAYQDDPDTGQPSSQAGPAQRFSNDEFDDDQEQSHTSAGRRFKYPQYWSTEEDQLAKVKSARGLNHRQIAEELGTGRTPAAVKNHLNTDKDWQVWSKGLDDEVLDLHQDTPGNWAHISNLLSGPERSKEEVEARVAYLEGVRDGREKPGQRGRRYESVEEDDRQIELRVAAGKGPSQIFREMPGRMSRQTMGKRIKELTAWNDDDDYLLLSQIGEYDGEVDWDYVGEAYDPPRDGEVVKTRWEYLRNRPLKRGR